MAEITAELDLEISRFKAALGQANSRLSSFSKRGERSGKGLGSGMARGLKSALLPAIAAIGVGAGISAIFSNALKEAAANEQLQVSMDVLVGDTSEATALMDRLRQEAATTPLQFEDLGNAAKKLLAFGSAAATVPEELRRIGDIASGIGAPIGEIAELYGKARVQGTLFAEDINQLTGRGIPVIQEFAAQLGVAESEVKKLGSQGKLTFDNLEQAFIKLTTEGGLFADMLGKQAETITGKWSTLKDGVALLYLEFGKPIADALKPVLEGAIARVGDLKDEARAVGESLGEGIDFAMAAVDTLSLSEGFELAGLVLKKAFQDAVNLLSKGSVAAVKVLQSDAFANSLEKAGLRFREIMLGIFADIARSMESTDPFGMRMGGIANVLDVQSRIAGGDREALEAAERPDAKSLASQFLDEFRRQSDVLDTEDSAYEIERILQKIGVAADERRAARGASPSEPSDAPTDPAPTASDIVPQLTSGPGAQVGLQSALSYLSGGNLQLEANSLLREIAANTRKKTEATKPPPVPGTSAAVFG